MAKTAHKRKKTKRVRHWAIWLENTNSYYLTSENTVVLYRTRDQADTMARRLFVWNSEPCRVDHLELRKI